MYSKLYQQRKYHHFLIQQFVLLMRRNNYLFPLELYNLLLHHKHQQKFQL